MPPISNQGRSANQHGKILEGQITPILLGNDYDVVSWADYKKNKAKFDAEDKLAITQVPYTTIYGCKGKTEFVMINKTLGRRIRIECKYQNAAGSVDEKLPYTYLQAALAYEEDETILCLGGSGFKKGAKEWLKKTCDSRWMLEGKPNRKIKLMTVDEITAFINDL